MAKYSNTPDNVELTVSRSAKNVVEYGLQDEFNIQELGRQWEELLQNGVIFKLSVKRWRGIVSLKPRDLGLSDDVLDEQWTLGNKKLLPASTIKRLHSLEQQARQRVTNSGIDTPWGTFIPERAYPNLKAEIERLRSQYFAVRDSICDEESYDSLLWNVYEIYKALGYKAYRRLCALEGKEYTDSDAEDFSAQTAKRAVNQIPSQEDLFDSFAMDYELYMVPVLTQTADTVNASTLPQDMKRDMVRSAQEQKAGMIDEFLRESKEAVNDMLSSAVNNVLKGIKKNGSIHPRSVAQLKSLVENLESLNFWDDRMVNRSITEIRKILDAAPDKRIDLGAEEALMAIAEASKEAALNLERQPKLRDVDIAGGGGKIEAREVHRELDGDDDEPDIDHAGMLDFGSRADRLKL